MTEENETPAQDAQPQEQKPAPTLAEMVEIALLIKTHGRDHLCQSRRGLLLLWLRVLIKSAISTGMTTRVG